MLDSKNIPSVDDDELLARYATQSNQYRSDLTVKPDLFIPHPHSVLSVTRHKDATEEEIWTEGKKVASQRKRNLYGRADIQAIVCRQQSLTVESVPLSGNPNHADIGGWPSQKSDQKAIALELAANIKLVPVSE